MPRAARLDAPGALHHVMIRGLEQGRRPELTGGGPRRSRAGWRLLEGIRRGREQWAFDERVLGGSEFVARIVEQYAASTPMSGRSCVEAEQQMDRLVRQTAVATDLTVDWRNVPLLTPAPHPVPRFARRTPLTATPRRHLL
jgi:hypothetical protein